MKKAWEILKKVFYWWALLFFLSVTLYLWKYGYRREALWNVAYLLLVFLIPYFLKRIRFQSIPRITLRAFLYFVFSFISLWLYIWSLFDSVFWNSFFLWLGVILALVGMVNFFYANRERLKIVGVVVLILVWVGGISFFVYRFFFLNEIFLESFFGFVIEHLFSVLYVVWLFCKGLKWLDSSFHESWEELIEKLKGRDGKFYKKEFLRITGLIAIAFIIAVSFSWKAIIRKDLIEKGIAESSSTRVKIGVLLGGKEELYDTLLWEKRIPSFF